MVDARVRVLSEPGESWVVEYDRADSEVLINADALGLADGSAAAREQLVEVGAALLAFLRLHPGATDEELTTIAFAPAGSVLDAT